MEGRTKLPDPREGSVKLRWHGCVHLESIGSLNLRHDELEPGLTLLAIDRGYATRGRSG